MRPIFFATFLAFHGLLPAQADSKALAREVVAQINWARQDPKAAAQELRTWLPRFEGGRYLAFPGETRLRTEEGVQAVKEAIAFLDRQRPLAPLAWSERLARSAEDLAKDQSVHGGLGHVGSDGSRPMDRVERYGEVSGSVGEVVTYGTFGDPGIPRRAALALIVDDGVPDRGHRALIFDGSFTLAGAAWGPHPIYAHMAAVDFCSGFAGGSAPRPDQPQRIDLSHALVEELNKARQNPAACAQELKAWLPCFKGQELDLPGDRPMRTLEGAAAVREAITALEVQDPRPALRWSDGLADSAAELAASESGSGSAGHSDGALDLEARLSRHGALGTPCAEAIAYGAFEGPGAARKALLAILVSDGAHDRRVLRLLMDSGLVSAGAAWDSHPSYGSVVVLDTAGNPRRVKL
ncbi:MAG TPA: CAP domain-containing protein [Holophagaceae bacterium]|nr:CAP domain-containing protein [Holophagaceae bacterium]